MPIAVIRTNRHRRELAGHDPEDRIELSDDHVSIVRLRPGPAFRQIEVEAASPDANALMDEASNVLVRAGAVPTDTTKLEVVLGERPESEIALPRTGLGIPIRDVVRFVSIDR